MNMLTAWWSQSSSTTMNLLVKPLAFAKSGSTTHIFRKIRFKHHLSMGLFISFLQTHQFLLNQLFCVFFLRRARFVPPFFHGILLGQTRYVPSFFRFSWGQASFVSPFSMDFLDKHGLFMDDLLGKPGFNGSTTIP